MIVFSAVALYLTSLWNKGFEIELAPALFLRTVLVVAIFYYLIMPITRLVLLPINFLTLGLISTIIYFLLFYFFFTRFALIDIKAWDFRGISLVGVTIKSLHINYITNVLLSSFSLSFIIRLLEGIL